MCWTAPPLSLGSGSTAGLTVTCTADDATKEIVDPEDGTISKETGIIGETVITPRGRRGMTVGQDKEGFLLMPRHYMRSHFQDLEKTRNTSNE